MFNEDDIRTALERTDPESPIIFKLRLGDMSNHFAGITDQQYQLVIDYMHQLHVTAERTQITTHHNHNVKKMITSNNTTWSTMKVYQYLNNSDFNLHLYIQQSSAQNEPVSFTPSMTKDKMKQEYQLTPHIQLVLSETHFNNQLTTVYEASFQFHDMGLLTLVEEIVKDVLRVINQTEILYTNTERLLMVHDCQKILQLSITNHLTIPLSKCQFIKLTDLKKLEGTYVVSTKAKGERRLLIIHLTGVWLVSPKPPHQYNLVLRYHPTILTTPIAYFIHAWNTSILDGELITAINKTEWDFNFKYWYLTYDCLAFNKRDVRQLDYATRMDYAITCKRIWPWYWDESYFTLSTQTQRGITNNIPDVMYQKIEEILALSETLNYEHTGLIFTPVNEPYINSVKYKYLDPTSTTIDFAIYNTGHPEFLKLYVYDETLEKEVEFKGTGKYPFDNTITQTLLPASYYNKKMIAECTWDNDFESIKLVKIRPDKRQADSVELALENWENMVSPVVKSGCPAI